MITITMINIMINNRIINRTSIMIIYNTKVTTKNMIRNNKFYMKIDKIMDKQLSFLIRIIN